MVLKFLNKKEIEKIFDVNSKLIIEYFLKKLLFSQPEFLTENSKNKNIQIPKEYLEIWVAQALGYEIIGAGNYPIDVFCKKNKIGADVKFISAKTDKNGNFTNSLSNETSLCQNFKDTGKILDVLFQKKEKKKIINGWINSLLKKCELPIEDYELKNIYFFIFIRSESSINLSIAKIDKNAIKNIKITKFTKTSALISGYIDEKYGNVKIYKSKKRMELRCNPLKLKEDNLLIEWNFSKNLERKKPLILRNIIKNSSKFEKYIRKHIKDFFNF